MQETLIRSLGQADPLKEGMTTTPVFLQSTGVGYHFLFQGIFPTQGSNPVLPHCWQILYHLSHQASPTILEWVAYPFSREPSADPMSLGLRAQAVNGVRGAYGCEFSSRNGDRWNQGLASLLVPTHKRQLPLCFHFVLVEGIWPLENS